MVEYCAAAAPGSVLLLGEYAVTEPDAPGVAMAIQPEVHATLEPGGSPRISGRMGAQWFTWTPARCDSPMFAALVAECGAPAGAITVDSTEFAGPHGKLGLGSSAAVAVAVATLLVATARAGEREDDRETEGGRAYAAPVTPAAACDRADAGLEPGPDALRRPHRDLLGHDGAHQRDEGIPLPHQPLALVAGDEPRHHRVGGGEANAGLLPPGRLPDGSARPARHGAPLSP